MTASTILESVIPVTFQDKSQCHLLVSVVSHVSPLSRSISSCECLVLSWIKRYNNVAFLVFVFLLLRRPSSFPVFLELIFWRAAVESRRRTLQAEGRGLNVHLVMSLVWHFRCESSHMTSILVSTTNGRNLYSQPDGNVAIRYWSEEYNIDL